MNNEPVAWINVEKRRLEWDKPTLWETPTVVKLDRIPLYTHPAKTLTDEEKIKLIGILKWAEDLLRSSCNDEAVNDVQDFLMILRKEQEK